MVERKRNFLKRFVAHHTLRKREAKWILDYWLRHPEKLGNVHFVTNASVSPRSLVMTAYGFDGEPFRYRRGDLVTMNPEKDYHDIRLHDGPIYVELNFQGMMIDENWVDIVEQNPFEPVAEVRDEVSSSAQTVIQASVALFEEERLLIEIDKALDRRDENLFRNLTTQLHQVRASKLF
ncbi:MAG: YpiB family protein [Exiguobacterium sp.]|uniref:ReoY family proteolytic degradation factor n=1 Tax=Exiguobacterium sp. TaxID=44751 RepID=UPI00257A4E41|nr:ReoY family proteolytic degradation factor [Exiguobacterium sp.]MBQ6458785.1 YpiB family protein [Exiguobacterium sp.]